VNSSHTTERQREVFAFFRSVELLSGAGPSTREIKTHFGFASQTAAFQHVRALVKKELLAPVPGKRGCFTSSPPTTRTVHVPVFGTVPAGLPERIEQEPEGYVSLEVRAAGVAESASLFATRVRGDSMINAHILEGDLAVFEAREPVSGQIVAALIDGETTLKRYVEERGRPFLKAENSKYPDLIPARELVIQGVLVHLQRNGLAARAGRQSPRNVTPFKA
jgi:repressor LexA